jgi:hypothetical protein
MILDRHQLQRVIRPEGFPDDDLWKWDETKDRHGRYRLYPHRGKVS